MEDTQSEKTERIPVYLSPESKQKIREAAARNGEQISAYVRRTTLQSAEDEAQTA